MGRFTFSKGDRLLKRGEFLNVSRWGKRVQNQHFILLYTPSRCRRNRLGITVTRKVGNAVSRNAIKRRVRECFRMHKADISGEWDINIIAKQTAAALPGSTAIDSLEKLFHKFRGEKKLSA